MSKRAETIECVANDMVKKYAPPLTPAKKQTETNPHTQTARLIEQTTSKAYVDGDADPGQSQLVQDRLRDLVTNGSVVAPPFNLFNLACMGEQSTDLGPAVDAYAKNIDGFGHQFVQKSDLAAIPGQRRRRVVEKEIQSERIFLTNWFQTVNLEQSFQQLRQTKTTDLELTGNAYWEVIRDSKGRLQGFETARSYQIRLTPRDKSPVLVDVPVPYLDQNNTWKTRSIRAWKYFRRYAQANLCESTHSGVATQTSTRWFKEFGDPRDYDSRTGHIITDLETFTREHGIDKVANEMVHFTINAYRSPYGVPRYVGAIIGIRGGRAAEEMNYVTLTHNNVPSLFITVSNGSLTDSSIQRLADFQEAQAEGVLNYGKMVVIETTLGNSEEDEDPGTAKIDIKPVTSDQHDDAMFKNYLEMNGRGLRRTMRLPEVYFGTSTEANGRTGEAMRRICDDQVFAQDRQTFDDWMNRAVMPLLGIRHHAYKSNSPNTTDSAQLVRILSQTERTGSISPEIGRIIIEEVLGRTLPAFPTPKQAGRFAGIFNPKVPFSLTLVEAQKYTTVGEEPVSKAVHDIEDMLRDNLGDDFDVDLPLSELLKPIARELRARLETEQT